MNTRLLLLLFAAPLLARAQSGGLPSATAAPPASSQEPQRQPPASYPEMKQPQTKHTSPAHQGAAPATPIQPPTLTSLNKPADAAHIFKRDPSTPAEAQPSTRAFISEILHNPRDPQVHTIYTKTHMMTALMFPPNDKILQIVCGDPDTWSINTDPAGSGTEHIVYIKPSRVGHSTNLMVITTSRMVMQFFLQEISIVLDPDTSKPIIADHDADKIPTGPDVMVTIRLSKDAATGANTSAAAPSRFIEKRAADQTIRAYQDQLAQATEHTAITRIAAEKVVTQQLANLQATYPGQMQFPYDIALNTPPFHVQAMYCDSKFTYIRLNTQEVPAIYEIVDGKPNIVNFEFQPARPDGDPNGVFVVRKILDQGHLVIGKAKLPFSRRKR